VRFSSHAARHNSRPCPFTNVKLLAVLFLFTESGSADPVRVGVFGAHDWLGKLGRTRLAAGCQATMVIGIAGSLSGGNCAWIGHKVVRNRSNVRTRVSYNLTGHRRAVIGARNGIRFILASDRGINSLDKPVRLPCKGGLFNCSSTFFSSETLPR